MPAQTRSTYHQPQRALQGNVLQSGYQLQHYRIGRNSMTDELAQAADQLRRMSDDDFRV